MAKYKMFFHNVNSDIGVNISKEFSGDTKALDYIQENVLASGHGQACSCNFDDFDYFFENVNGKLVVDTCS